MGGGGPGWAAITNRDLEKACGWKAFVVRDSHRKNKAEDLAQFNAPTGKRMFYTVSAKSLKVVWCVSCPINYLNEQFTQGMRPPPIPSLAYLSSSSSTWPCLNESRGALFLALCHHPRGPCLLLFYFWGTHCIMGSQWPPHSPSTPHSHCPSFVHRVGFIWFS